MSYTETIELKYKEINGISNVSAKEEVYGMSVYYTIKVSRHCHYIYGVS